MHYLVSYEYETAVLLKEDVNLSKLDKVHCPYLKQFLKKVGKAPLVKIDEHYPSYQAVLDNFKIFGEKR